MAKKKETTYADEGRNILSKYKFYLGEDFDKYDPLALNSLEREMNKLQKEQEVIKEKEGLNNDKTFKNGGDILGTIGGVAPYIAGGAALYGGGKAIGNYLDRFSEMGTPLDYSDLQVTPQTANTRLDPSAYGVTADTVDPNFYTPETIDLASEREGAKRRGNTSRSILRKQSGTSGSQAAQMAQAIAGEGAINRNTNEAINRSLLQEQQYNVGAANRAGEINTTAANQVAQVNAANALRASQTSQQGRMFADQSNLGTERFNIQNQLQAEYDRLNRTQSEREYNAGLDYARDAGELGARENLVSQGSGLANNLLSSAPEILELLKYFKG